MTQRATPPAPNPHALRASGDRWLFGYADIVTLLFACFATLYAAKATAPAAPPAAAATASPRVAPVRVTAPPAPIAATVVPPAEPRSALTDDLQSVLGREGKLPGLELGASTRGLVISLPEAGSFPPGQADLSPRAQAVMLDLAATLRHYPNQIRVEGHTDDIPIHTPRFASNWELSTARATRVVQFLIDEGGLDPVRLAAAGYGEFRPRVPNTTAEARARNRRVDIVVLDPGAATREDPEGGQP